VLPLVAVLLLAGCAAGHADHAAPAGHPAPADTPAELTTNATPTLPPPQEPAGPGERFVVVGVPDGPHEPAPRVDAHDDYRCFLVDPGVDEDAFITGVQFLPGNDEIVHHAILYRVPPGQAAAEDRDADEDGSGWTCFGGSGLEADVRELSSLDSAPWLTA
jgi:hypothetical protein